MTYNFYNSLNPLYREGYNSDLPLVVELSNSSSTQLHAGQNYYLLGCTGSGKTTRALQLSKAFIDLYAKGTSYEEAQRSVRFIKFKQLLDLFKSFSDESKKQIDELRKAKLLIIDDLGVGFGKDYTLSELEDFIDERYSMLNKAVTIFTTNIKFSENSELKEAFSRIISRIRAMCTATNMLEIKSIDYRTTKREVQTFDFETAGKKNEVIYLDHRNYGKDGLSEFVDEQNRLLDSGASFRLTASNDEIYEYFGKLDKVTKPTTENVVLPASEQVKADNTGFKNLNWQEAKAEIEKNRAEAMKQLEAATNNETEQQYA